MTDLVDTLGPNAKNLDLNEPPHPLENGDSRLPDGSEHARLTSVLLDALIRFKNGDSSSRKQRMTVPGSFGGWADEIGSLHALIDDPLWPTTEVTRAIGAVAEGDLEQSMALDVEDRPLEGEFLRSARLVNEMIDPLSVFTSVVTRVARDVGTEGKLGGVPNANGRLGVGLALSRLAALHEGSLSLLAHSAGEGLRRHVHLSLCRWAIPCRWRP